MKKAPKVLAGFDGFVDTIARPVLKTGRPGQAPEYFRTIEDFGTYISGRSGKGASIELEVFDRRMGGNMPNFAKGISSLGAEVSAIGMLGVGMHAVSIQADDREQIDPVFLDLPGRLFSFAPAGSATALEFEDGKVFLAPRYALQEKPWLLIEKACGGHAALAALLEEADIIACLNWSELEFMDELWQTLYERCAVLLKPDREKIVLFDLCDFSRRSDEEIRRVLGLIAGFSAFRKTILSLNRNEALLLGQLPLPLDARPQGKKQADDLAGIAENLAAALPIDEICVHTHEGALVKTNEGVFYSEAEKIAKPKISTGAGDHFNAAYVFAAFRGLSPAERLNFANRCAHAYITTGAMPHG